MSTINIQGHRTKNGPGPFLANIRDKFRGSAEFVSTKIQRFDGNIQKHSNNNENERIEMRIEKLYCTYIML